MDGDSALPSVGAGRLLSTALHTWLGRPCGAAPGFAGAWGPGSRHLRQEAGREEPCSTPCAPAEESLHALQNKAWGWGQACSLPAFLTHQPRASAKRSRAMPGHFRAGWSPSGLSCQIPWQGVDVSTVPSTCSLDTSQVGSVWGREDASKVTWLLGWRMGAVLALLCPPSRIPELQGL